MSTTSKAASTARTLLGCTGAGAACTAHPLNDDGACAVYAADGPYYETVLAEAFDEVREDARDEALGDAAYASAMSGVTA